MLLFALALMPAEPESPEAPQVIDFFYSVFLMLVLGVVILGSFTFMTLGRVPYLEALTNTVFLIAGTIFVLGLAWSPRTGYAGLNVFFSRYLFSIGLPVEKWLYFLAELSQTESRPERFLAEGVAGLARLSWIAGAALGRGRPARRDRRAHRARGALRRPRAGLTIYSRYRTSPALQWHMHLLGQLLGEFYAAKLREQKLRAGELPAGGARNRRAPDARREEPAAVAERAVLGRRPGRFAGAAGADAPPAAGHHAAPVGDAGQAAAPGRR